MPTKSEMTVSTGHMRMPASTRGTTSLRIGIGAERAQRVDLLGDDHRSELGGDARADAARSISAVSTGPSSLIIDALTSRPTNGRAPNWSSVMPLCSASTAPVKKPVSSTTVSDPEPMCVELLDRCRGSRTAGVNDARESPPSRAARTPAPRATAAFSHSIECAQHASALHRRGRQARGRRPAALRISSRSARRLLEVEVGGGLPSSRASSVARCAIAARPASEHAGAARRGRARRSSRARTTLDSTSSIALTIDVGVMPCSSL